MDSDGISHFCLLCSSYFVSSPCEVINEKEKDQQDSFSEMILVFHRILQVPLEDVANCFVKMGAKYPGKFCYKCDAFVKEGKILLTEIERFTLRFQTIQATLQTQLLAGFVDETEESVSDKEEDNMTYLKKTLMDGVKKTLATATAVVFNVEAEKIDLPLQEVNAQMGIIEIGDDVRETEENERIMEVSSTMDEGTLPERSSGLLPTSGSASNALNSHPIGPELPVIVYEGVATIGDRHITHITTLDPPAERRKVINAGISEPVAMQSLKIQEATAKSWKIMITKAVLNIRGQKQKADLNRIYKEIQLYFAGQQEAASGLYSELKRHIKRMVLAGELLRMYSNGDLEYRTLQHVRRILSPSKDFQKCCVKCIGELLDSVASTTGGNAAVCLFGLNDMVEYIQHSHMMRYPVHLKKGQECQEWLTERVCEALKKEETHSTSTRFRIRLKLNARKVEVRLIEENQKIQQLLEKYGGKGRCENGTAV